jgi:hypothetical protein
MFRWQLAIRAPVDGSVFVMGTITELVAEIVVSNLAVASNIILMYVHCLCTAAAPVLRFLAASIPTQAY